MSKTALITWNLHGQLSGKDAKNATKMGMVARRVENCVSWLDRHITKIGIDRAVAVFQEVPDRFAAILASSTGWSVVGAAEHHVAIAVMGPVKASNVAALDATSMGAGNRALRVDVEGILSEKLRLIGLHWLDRLNHHPPARDSKGSKFWSNIRLQWNFPEEKHFVVLGDFNENPYDHALVSQECLWAIRDRADLMGRSQHIDRRPPLFNPMWRFLPERLDPLHGPHGTCEWLKNEVSGVRWAHFDQILLSPSIVDLLHKIDVLVELDGELLVSERGVPDLSKASDHLPIIAILGA